MFNNFGEAALGINTSAYPGKWLTAIRMNPNDPDGARQSFLELGGEYIAGHPEGPLPSKRDAQSALELLRQLFGILPISSNALSRIEAFVEQVEETVPNSAGFYMVHADGGYPPTKRHAERAVAVAEAERIARKNGQPTFLLEATEKFTPTTTVDSQRLRITPTDVVPFGPGFSNIEFVTTSKTRTAA